MPPLRPAKYQPAYRNSSLHLHNTAFAALWALLQVTFILVLSKHGGLGSPHAGNLDSLFALEVPPSQPLNQTAIYITGTNSPLSRGNFDLASVFWKMELWKTYVCGEVF